MIPIDPDLRARLLLLREPHAVFCRAEDNLRLSTWCSSSGVTQITVAGRFLTCEGNIIDFRERQAPNTDRTLKASNFPLAEGWLLDVRIESDGAPIIGQVFASCAIVRGLTGGVTPLKVLCQGVCNAVQPLAWPNSILTTTIGSPTILRSVTGTNPAAGVEISETVPTGARWILRGLSFLLVTSGVAGNRETSIVIDDGATTLFTSPSGFTHVASLTRRFSASALGAQTAPTQGTDRQILIPPLVLLAGSRIKTVTTAIDAGDDYGAPQMLVEEQLEAAA